MDEKGFNQKTSEKLLDGMYERGDLGHPSAKAVKLWFEHLDKYMESN